jgi:Domain of unknown function (DUF4386)
MPSNGVALKVMVDHWAAAPEAQQQPRFEVAFAVRQIEVGVASLLQLLFGSAGVLFGIAIIASTAYPTWLGWVAVASGTGTAVGGVLTAMTGFSEVAMDVTMLFTLLMLAWTVASGILMWRRPCGHGCGSLEHFPEKACPGLDPGWMPVFRKKMRPSMNF